MQASKEEREVEGLATARALARSTCSLTSGRRLQVPPCAAQKRSQNSARERLLKNPAYQRLKQSSWKDSYKPSETDKPPGPIPQHLLNNVDPKGDQQAALAEELKASAPKEQSKGTGTVHTISHSQRSPNSSGNQGPQQAARNGKEIALQAPSTSVPERKQPVRSFQQGRVTRVKFSLKYHAQFGQRMRMVGSLEPVGRWVLSKGVELQWNPGDSWTAILELQSGSILEYKYVLLQSDGVNAVGWQNGNNNVLAVGHGDDDVEVFDNWESAPGASVVAAGETSTREGRLLNWASEIESLFANQRAELRKSRMELATAQDEARMAREEARQFQAELRASEAARAKAEMAVKELTISGTMLRTQLAETSRSFQKAIETTHNLLKEAQAERQRQEAELNLQRSRGSDSGEDFSTDEDSDTELSAPARAGGTSRPAFSESFRQEDTGYSESDSGNELSYDDAEDGSSEEEEEEEEEEEMTFAYRQRGQGIAASSDQAAQSRSQDTQSNGAAEVVAQSGTGTITSGAFGRVQDQDSRSHSSADPEYNLHFEASELRSSPSKHDEVDEDQRFDPHSNGGRPSPDAWLSGDSAASRDPHSSASDPQNSNGATSNGNSMGSFFSDNFDFQSDPNGGYMADIGSENESPSSIMLARSGELDMHLDDRLGPYGYGAPEHLDFDIDDDDIYDEEVDSAIAEEHHTHGNGLSQLDTDLDTHHPEFDPVSSSISSDLETLWDLLAEQSRRGGKVWSLPPETSALFPGATHGLFVRASYGHLYQVLIEKSSRRTRKSRDMLVRGSTGLGKSYWLLHLLGKLSAAGSTVVFESDSQPNVAFLFSSGSCRRGVVDDFRDVLHDKSTVYIVDGKPPRSCQAMTVLLCSPKQASDSELTSREIYVMPPWSFEELEEALPLFPDVSHETLRRRYGQWGGSIKWCLEKANDPENDTHLKSVISGCTIDMFKASFDERKHSQVPDELVFHIPKPGQALFSGFQVASKHISDHILVHLCEEGEENCSQFLLDHFDLASSSRPAGPVMRSLLESWTALTFCQNRSMVARYPNSGDLKVTSLEECPRWEFQELNEVEEREETAVWRPASDDFQALAFIRQPDDVVHMAFDNRPPELSSKIVMQCLEALHDAKQDKPVNLTCVMPPNLYEIRRKMPLRGSLNNARLQIKQRFIKIPLSTQATAALPCR